MVEYTENKFKERKYFSATKNYTIALLDALNGTKFWVETEDPGLQRERAVPISFGNYEKAQVLEGLRETDIRKGNFNYLPRLVLSFEGLSKDTTRQTNKFQKLTKRLKDPNTGRDYLDIAYNSVAYLFNYTLLLQTRGLSINTQITEEILVRFNPTLNLMIKEFPIFNQKTETQIIISDPAFEILDEFSETDVNIIQTTFDITIRGNIYNEIEIQGPIKTVKFFNHLWDGYQYELSKLASYYKFDVDQQTHYIKSETARIFDATVIGRKDIEGQETDVIEKRVDYQKYEAYTEFLSPFVMPDLFKSDIYKWYVYLEDRATSQRVPSNQNQDYSLDVKNL